MAQHQRRWLLAAVAAAALTGGPAGATTFGPGDHFVSVDGFVPAGTDYIDLSLTGSNTSTDPFGGFGFSEATADIASGTLHSYATALNGGSAYAVSSRSVPVIINGPVRTGIATMTMTVHGVWQVGTFTSSSLTSDGNIQFDGYLYNFGDGLTPIHDELSFGHGGNCAGTDAGCIPSLFTGSGTIDETLTLNVPFDLDFNSLIQLTGDLRAQAGGQGTMDLSHTATFSITVPSGDSYSTILGSGAAPIPEPAALGVFGIGVLVLAATGRRRCCLRRLAIGALGIDLAGCASPAAAPPAGKQLSAGEIRSTLLGTTGHGTGDKGDFTIYTAPDGAMRLRSGAFSDTGTARITDDGHWCTTWQHLRSGAEACQTVFQDDDRIRFILPDGSVSSTVRVKPGNPENL